MFKVICSSCNALINGKEVKGSLKHPYCTSCFTKIWKDDTRAYLSWLSENHTPIPNGKDLLLGFLTFIILIGIIIWFLF